MSVPSRLAPRNEDDIALAAIGVLVLKKEEVVDAVVAQGRGFDDHTKRAGQFFLNDKILLPTHLSWERDARLSVRCCVNSGHQQEALN